MKNIPCLVLLSPFVGFGLLALASTFGVSFPFAFIAAHLLGFTCAAGALVMFMKDYASRPRRTSLVEWERRRALQPITAPAEPAKEPASRAVTQPRPGVRPATPRLRPVVRPSLSAFGFTNDPSTLSLS